MYQSPQNQQNSNAIMPMPSQQQPFQPMMAPQQQPQFYPQMVPQQQVQQQPQLIQPQMMPQQQIQPQMIPQQQLIVIQPQPIMYTPSMLQEYPQMVTCPNCKRTGISITQKEIGTGTIVAGVLIAAVGCWLGCCLIPCFVDECKDIHHICLNCGYRIGSRRFLCN